MKPPFQGDSRLCHVGIKQKQKQKKSNHPASQLKHIETCLHNNLYLNFQVRIIHRSQKKSLKPSTEGSWIVIHGTVFKIKEK